MKQGPYYYEIYNLVTQFVHAFDDIVLKRVDNAELDTPEYDGSLQHLAVRFVYAPKSKTIHNLIDKNEHITLPCISVWITRIERDPDRITNKMDGYRVNRGSKTKLVPAPIPINVTINMSIMTKYQNDMFRIVSNFVPYIDPYFYISWARNGTLDEEIRTEVKWNGGIDIQPPLEQPEKYSPRWIGDTSFVIKGYLFKKQSDPQGNIFKIDTEFSPHIEITNFENMEIEKENMDEYDSVGVDGLPDIFGISSTTYKKSESNNLSIYGEFLGEYVDAYVEDIEGNMFTDSEIFDLFYGKPNHDTYPSFYGVRIGAFERDDNGFKRLLILNIPEVNKLGYFNIILANPSGYVRLTDFELYNHLTGIQVVE